MKVLITGGAGYLGSILSLHLTSLGHEVRAFDCLMYGGRSLLSLAGHKNFEFMRGDLRDPVAVKNALVGIDGVVHLGSIVGDPACAQDPDLAREVNVGASRSLITAVREAGVGRFVFASTCSNYGRMKDTSVLATEESELHPVSLYAESKVAVEQHLLSLPPAPTAITITRFATLYGLSPRMRFDLTVNEFVMEMMVNRKIVVYGEQFWRPYVHVRDAARAVTMVLESPVDRVAGQVFNVGDTRENYRKADLLELMSARIPEAEVQKVPKAEDPRDYRVSFDRIKDRLGYSITRCVADGIEEISSALRAGIIDDPAESAHYNVKP